MRNCIVGLIFAVLLTALPSSRADGLNGKEAADLVDVADQPFDIIKGKLLRLRVDLPIPAGKRSKVFVNSVPTNVRRDGTVVTNQLAALGFNAASSANRVVPAGTLFKVVSVVNLSDDDDNVLSRINLQECDSAGHIINDGGFITNLSIKADHKLTVYELLTFSHYTFGPGEKL